MSYDCIVFKQGFEPFIISSPQEHGKIDYHWPQRGTHEIFYLEKIEIISCSGLSVDTYLIANPARISREEIVKEIQGRSIKPIKSELN